MERLHAGGHGLLYSGWPQTLGQVRGRFLPSPFRTPLLWRGILTVPASAAVRSSTRTLLCTCTWATAHKEDEGSQPHGPLAMPPASAGIPTERISQQK